MASPLTCEPAVYRVPPQARGLGVSAKAKSRNKA